MLHQHEFYYTTIDAIVTVLFTRKILLRVCFE